MTLKQMIERALIAYLSKVSKIEASEAWLEDFSMHGGNGCCSDAECRFDIGYIKTQAHGGRKSYYTIDEWDPIDFINGLGDYLEDEK